MNISRYRVVSVTTLLMLGLVLQFVAVPPAHGQVTIVRLEFHDTFTDIGGNECLPPEVIGVVAGTVTVTGQELETKSGFHFRATDTLDYRVDFSDGSYALGTAVEHEEINFNMHISLIVDTLAIHESRILYAADGQPIGRVMIHFLSHVTYRDVNDNFQPDPDELTATIEDFRFKCH
jgi:hypothetical protein